MVDFVYALGPFFFLVVDLPIAWDQAPDWVKEKKNEDKLDSEASRAVAWGGERFFFFFAVSHCFFCFAFFPPLMWSLVPG